MTATFNFSSNLINYIGLAALFTASLLLLLTGEKIKHPFLFLIGLHGGTKIAQMTVILSGVTPFYKYVSLVTAALLLEVILVTLFCTLAKRLSYALAGAITAFYPFLFLRRFWPTDFPVYFVPFYIPLMLLALIGAYVFYSRPQLLLHLMTSCCGTLGIFIVFYSLFMRLSLKKAVVFVAGYSHDMPLPYLAAFLIILLLGTIFGYCCQSGKIKAAASN